MTSTFTEMLPHTRRANVSNSVWYMGSLVTFLATAEETNGQYGLIECVTKAGNEPPMHVHEHEDELFYLVEGEADFIVDDQTISARSGSSVMLPRNVPHTFVVRSKQIRALIFITPGGFERYFSELSEPARAMRLPESGPSYSPEVLDRFAEIAARYGVRFIAPNAIATSVAA